MKKINPVLKKLIVDTISDICSRNLKRGTCRSDLYITISRFRSDIYCELKEKLDSK